LADELVMYFVSIFNDLFESGHVFLLVTEEILEFILENNILIVDVILHFHAHFIQPLENSNLLRLIIIKIIFFY
jgi:hypothetical protein